MMPQSKSFPRVWWFILSISILLLSGGLLWMNSDTLEAQLNDPESASHHEALAASNLQKISQLPLPQQPPQGDSGEDLITAILGDESLEPHSTVIQLIKALPRLDTTSQEEAAHHIANLSDDTSATNWTQMLISNQLPAPAAEILFNNLLSRSEELVLPTLTAIADRPNHPQQSESVEILEPLIGTPKPGFTWIKWSKQGR